MIKNIKYFNKKSEGERLKYLRSLTPARAARILENLLRSKIWEATFYRHTDNPFSIGYTLKHAKYTR